jgi:hypothetical protein
VVPEAQNSKAARRQVTITPLVARQLFVAGVRRSINLDDKSRMMAGDIGIVRADLHLPAEMVPLLTQ